MFVRLSTNKQIENKKTILKYFDGFKFHYDILTQSEGHQFVSF
jgi:hypothetical protein